METITDKRRKNVDVKNNKKEYYKQYYLEHKKTMNNASKVNYTKLKLKSSEMDIDIDQFGEHALKYSNFMQLLSFMKTNFPDELKRILEQP